MELNRIKLRKRILVVSLFLGLVGFLSISCINIIDVTYNFKGNWRNVYYGDEFLSFYSGDFEMRDLTRAFSGTYSTSGNKTGTLTLSVTQKKEFPTGCWKPYMNRVTYTYEFSSQDELHLKFGNTVAVYEKQ